MEPRFSILTFPQRYDGAGLLLHVLILPRLSNAWSGNPLLSVIDDFPDPGDKTPAFADANWQLEARILSGWDRFPAHAPVDDRVALPAASGAPPNARKLFDELIAPLAGRFKLTGAAPRLAEPVRKEIFIRKYLPLSYRDSFLFSGRRTRDAVTDDSYRCAVKERKDPNPAFQPTPDEVSWGQIYAHCLRQLQLARRLGLIREAVLPVDPVWFEEGGYLYVDLAPGSDYLPQLTEDFDFIKRYAARIPRLEAGTPRTVFAAVHFPVLFDDPGIVGPPVVPGNYDEVFIEAADYDDGFAKIVHGTQPVSQNLLAEERDGFAPLIDIGIRLGWDDEQILIWQNRQLKEDPTVPGPPGDPQRLDAPMGVFGYRVDAREHDSGQKWHSLVSVQSKVPLKVGPIQLDPNGLVFEGELGVEVHPMQLDGNQATGQFWLPSYMTQWNGKSLVLPDEDASALFQTEQTAQPAAAASLGRVYDPVGLEDVALHYGDTYDFRVRLMDPTGGGPEPDANPVHESLAGEATLTFRRHVVPEGVRMQGVPRFPDDALDALFPADELEIGRPLLGYPSVVFTDKYPDPIPLLQAASIQATGKDSFGIPDPDVQRVRIDVEVRTLRMDNLLSISGREPFIHYYTTERDYPADFAHSLTVPMKFVDAPVLNFGDPNDLGDLGLDQNQIDGLSELVLPTAREIRLTLRAVADADPTYFAEGANVGKPVQLKVRRDSVREPGLLAATSTARKIRGIYLQPDPAPALDGKLGSFLFLKPAGDNSTFAQRLAEQLGVEQKGLTLVGKNGERVIFGCSRRIRHTLAPDHSSLTFAAKEDLFQHWIVALTLQVDRDWTWDSLDGVGFEIFRELRFRSDTEVDDNGGRPIGDWEINPTASIQALSDPQRGQTTLVYLDAVEPKSERKQAADPTEMRFPDIIELEYRVEPHFRHTPAGTDAPELLQLSLPVTTEPSQIPQIVSAGVALSKYERNETYSTTEPRRRYLWLELSEPVRDPNDAFFIRLLANAPDPLLSDGREETFAAREEPELPVDPELIRVVSPGQSDDQAGLAAMVRLEAAGNSDRHFLVPLPPGLHAESPELFGFFTYELRVGHAAIWSTAQGRFSRALRTTGVQHPPPTLFCTVQTTKQEIVVEAPYARAVLDGKNVTAVPPRTEIWALLYAQVHQADGKDYRNILLEDRPMDLLPPVRDRYKLAFQNQDATARGAVRWTRCEVIALLRDLGLPGDSPISVLCVEMMPTLQALVRGREVERRATRHREDSYYAHFPSRFAAGATLESHGPRPLSDALGHYRILRTSPLTMVPAVCPV